MSPIKIDEILDRIPKMSDTAIVPVPVAARHDNVSERTIRRNYPLIQLSPGRNGVSVGYLRNRRNVAA